MKKRSHAAALRYQDSDEIPKVVAMGYGQVAATILALAEKSGVPIQEDDGLSELLSSIQVGSEVQHESFQLVAEILCFLYEVDEKWREQHSFMDEIISPALISSQSSDIKPDI